MPCKDRTEGVGFRPAATLLFKNQSALTDPDPCAGHLTLEKTKRETLCVYETTHGRVLTHVSTRAEIEEDLSQLNIHHKKNR